MRRVATPDTRAGRIAAPSLLLAGSLLAVGSPALAQRNQPPENERFRNPYAWPALPELVEHSDMIVAGEVLDMRSAWTADRREIFTTVTLRTERRFKGAGRDLVRFRVPGGTVGDTRMTATHSAQFMVGERALVFLTGESGRLPRVTSGEAGKRHVRTGEDGADRILPGFALVESDPGRMGFDTLDDLAAALSGPLAPASR
ncbi:MAG: hypothetical protein F4Y71_10920 [Acidobacteria bacterium]|nr:hypothetical protein [Acidobacteriota bacterium]MYG75717.1 hypothetical protein [Acidobacteriota bacterium]